MDNFFKLGAQNIELSTKEEHFNFGPGKSFKGFGLRNNKDLLQMFASSYDLIASSKKGLLYVDGHFSADEPPMEYVFSLGPGIFGIFYTIFSGADYLLKAAVVKENMNQEDAFNIIKDMSKKYISYKKELQKQSFLKGKKELDDVILPEELKNTIISDIECFLMSKDKYKKLGMIWKRGYIFHGPPGNGKTMLLRKLAPAFGLELIDITKRIENDGTLRLPQDYMGPDYDGDLSFNLEKFALGHEDDIPVTLYFLEDMDKVIGKNENDYGRITLSNFLTALDGVSRLANGLIIIGTTNNKDQLSNAILGRPGRFDRIYEFKKPEVSEIITFFEQRHFKIKDPETTRQYAEKLFDRKFSMAFVEDLVLSSVTHFDTQKISTKNADFIIGELEKYNKLEVEPNKLGFSA